MEQFTTKPFQISLWGKMQSSEEPYRTCRYEIQAGDTMASITNTFAVSEQDLLSVNITLPVYGMREGMCIYIPLPVSRLPFSTEN